MAKKATKPTKSNLRAALAKTGPQKPQASAPMPAASGRAQPPSRQGRKAMTIYVSAEGWRALYDTALDENQSLQGLAIEALNALLRSRGKPAIA